MHTIFPDKETKAQSSLQLGPRSQSQYTAELRLHPRQPASKTWLSATPLRRRSQFELKESTTSGGQTRRKQAPLMPKCCRKGMYNKELGLTQRDLAFVPRS